MRVKCLAQEHNTMTPARARIRTSSSRVQQANHLVQPPQYPETIFSRLLTLVSTDVNSLLRVLSSVIYMQVRLLTLSFYMYLFYLNKVNSENCYDVLVTKV